MICYRCGCTLSEKDFCTGCGADVGMYKKILAMSNRYYNNALEKASVRDLSGATALLKQSLKLNKNNVEARNLLGLIYYETGEVIEALGQWVISKNIRDEKNIATDYIAMMQENQTQFDQMNQNLKKFNQSLMLCYQDSLDYAQIQLKKILSIAPKYLKAHQLLALIYIKGEEWEKAKREVEKCNQIDANNTTSMRYMQEIEAMLAPEEGVKTKEKKQKRDDVRIYQSGNETIIQPVNKSDSKAASVLIYLGLGMAIGIAITFFLVLPSRIQSAKAEVNEELRVVSEASDAKTATIDELELQISTLQAENNELSENIGALASGDGSYNYNDCLMNAVNAYLNDPEDIEAIGEYLEGLEIADVSEDMRSDAFNTLYDYLMSHCGDSLSTYYYDKGYASYSNEDYESAIPDLRRAYSYASSNEDALFYLANSLRRTGEEDEAKEKYGELIDLFPDTEKAVKAQTYLTEMNS